MEKIYDPLIEWLKDNSLQYVFGLWLSVNLKSKKNLKEFESETPEIDKFLEGLNDMNQQVNDYLLFEKVSKIRKSKKVINNTL